MCLCIVCSYVCHIAWSYYYLAVAKIITLSPNKLQTFTLMTYILVVLYALNAKQFLLLLLPSNI